MHLVSLKEFEELAELCHRNNQILQHASHETVSPDWNVLDEVTRQSAREGVLKALEGYTPEQLHESWMEFKIKHGWTYGLSKDEVRKTHPCIVPYNELPEAQKLKDKMFQGIVQAFIASK